MPMEWNLLVQISGPDRPVTTQCKTILKIPYAKYWDVSSGLPGPISANGVEFRLTVDQCGVSFGFLFWPFLACQNGKTE